LLSYTGVRRTLNPPLIVFSIRWISQFRDFQTKNENNIINDYCACASVRRNTKPEG